MLVAIVIVLLTTLSYLRDVSYYIDAALALALLALTATLVAARYVTRGGPSDDPRHRRRRRCCSLGLLLATIGLYGLLRMPDIFHQLHPPGWSPGPP